MQHFRFVALVCVVSVIALAARCHPADVPSRGVNWPQWRGPDGSGVSPETNLPAEWNDQKNIEWKTPLPGRGHSSPIVWGGRIFLTTSIEGPEVPGAAPVKHQIEGKEFLHPDSVGGNRRHTLKVLCVDAAAGKILWERTAYEGAVYDNRHKKNTFASPTPATDGRLVYAFFGSEGLYAYDFSGKPAWKFTPGGIATMGMGAGTSPVLFESLVILQCDEDSGERSFLVALDKKTGREVWRTPRKVQVSWATPILVKAGNRMELVTSGNENVIAYDPATGKELWRSAGVQSNAIPSPVAGHGLVFVTAGFPAKRVFAIRPGGSGDVTATPNVVWKYEKGTAYVPSPILYGGYLYLVTDRGLVTCLDAKTGEVKYEGARVPAPAMFTSSLVAMDGKLFLTSEDGDTFVIKAGPQHEVLGANSLKEPIYASLAVSHGRIFIRGDKHLYAIHAR